LLEVGPSLNTSGSVISQSAISESPYYLQLPSLVEIFPSPATAVHKHVYRRGGAACTLSYSKGDYEGHLQRNETKIGKEDNCSQEPNRNKLAKRLRLFKVDCSNIEEIEEMGVDKSVPCGFWGIKLEHSVIRCD
jgi:hypothetical protein